MAIEPKTVQDLDTEAVVETVEKVMENGLRSFNDEIEITDDDVMVRRITIESVVTSLPP